MDELVSAGKIQRKQINSGSIKLYTPEYLLQLQERQQQASEPTFTPQWNACRNYAVPRSMVAQFRDTSIPVPEEYRVD
ncbi:MAG: hypothetical protein ACP5RH_01065 [Leptodesmis sp.]|uniref:hypothetical protein n=1 Tax=Leptodesmis sp. TaxID=3100501 RepID=UPI003D0D5DF4